MWIYVFLGNALRGIGETPITPLGISYIDDFAKAENSAFYISCLQTITLLGPMFGFLLGSMCANLYVDIGFVSVGFLPSLKRLLCTPAYFLLLCGIVLKFSSFIGLLTFKAKYMEQQFGQSASRANFLIGVLILPVVAVGIFLGGLLMKRYKLSVVAGAQLSFITSFTAFLLLLFHFSTKCDNLPVAGLTVSYNGCVLTPSPVEGSRSVSLGQCPRGPRCTRSFTSYMAVTVLSSFINSLGTTPGYMITIRVIFLSLTTCLSGCSYFFIIAVIVLLRKQFKKEEVFIGLLAFCFFTKSLTGAYTKSTISQIERRFEIPSSTVGIIDGSFEMGNLLVITVVSYFGAKFHRPKIIGAGVLLMGIGTLIMALPHFIMSRYMYDTAAAHTNDPANFTMSSTFSSDTQNTVQQLVSGCLKGEVESSPTWVIVLFGNILRGIGEAGIGPLGMSFIDDYARPGNSAFYIGCLHTFGVIGPIFGYSLGSLCASLYVDIGLVDQESVTITPQDSRWVGAWWLGYVVSGLLTLLAALPLWFLPRALPENPQTSKAYHPSNEHKHTLSITEIAK
ncbi:hypothetical protein cypCar_00042711, partial [Cyprinus carpio]